MRKIKFRGMEYDSKKWVYGFAVVSENIAFIIAKSECKTCGDEFECDHARFPCYKNSIEVIPETVGQSTGLKDKNGVEIYEGDIVKCVWGGTLASTGDIRFDVENGRWSFNDKEVVHPLAGIGVRLSHVEKVEVISTVHD